MKLNDIHLLLLQNKYGLLSLEIPDVTERDMGTFTCKAVNSEGEATCSATLEVVGMYVNYKPENIPGSYFFTI